MSIKIDEGSWLASGTNPASTLNRKRLGGANFYFLKREPRHRCSMTVQPCKEIFVLHVFKFWVTYPCKGRCYSSLKSEFKLQYPPTSFFTINVDFYRIQFEGYCIYRPNSCLWWKIHIIYSQTVPGFFDTPHRWLSMLRKKCKHWEK